MSEQDVNVAPTRRAGTRFIAELPTGAGLCWLDPCWLVICPPDGEPYMLDYMSGEMRELDQ